MHRTPMDNFFKHLKLPSEEVPTVALLATLLIIGVSGVFLTPNPEPIKITDLETPDYFSELPLEAKAVYVFDAKTGEVLFSKNAEMQLPLASLTKLMTGLIAAEQLGSQANVSVPAEALKREGDTGLLVGERWNPLDLIRFTLVNSSNDGAAALANVVGSRGIEFSTVMNQRSAELGLTQTYFLNETGLDATEEVSGGYGSARDVTTLMNTFLSTLPDVLDATRYPTLDVVSKDAFKHTAENTNTAIGKIPGLVGSKTGYTDLAGGNLVIAFDSSIDHPVVITVLGSSAEGRFNDVEALANAALLTIAHRGGGGTIEP